MGTKAAVANTDGELRAESCSDERVRDAVDHETCDCQGGDVEARAQ
jgi:hypothetical protein